VTSRGEMDARLKAKLYPTNKQASFRTYGLYYKPSPMHVHTLIGTIKNHINYQRTSNRPVTLPSVKFLKDNS